MLYIDLPTLSEIKELHTYRNEACVSIYLETTPLTQHVDGCRIELGNLVKKGLAQLEANGLDKTRLGKMSHAMNELIEDDEFWRLQAHSLAVLLTPEHIRTFRLPNRLSNSVLVSDRFHLKPLLRSITFKHSAFVLALSENAPRLVEIFADLPPVEIKVPGMPVDASEFTIKEFEAQNALNPRIHGAEGQKVRLAQYARAVDAALRTVLAGRDLPLVLIATQPLSSIFTSVNSYPDMLPDFVAKSPDHLNETELAAAARPILDKAYTAQVADVKALYETRFGSGRGTTDLSDAARAATFGAIEALLVDIDQVIPGTIDPESGAIEFAGKQGPLSYDIIDEIVGRALISGARVLAVRSDDIPGGGQLAAVLRYPV